VVSALASPVPPDRPTAAYAYCERLAREHYENFPVASWLLPPAMRPHIAAIYAFARRADDFADEPGPDAAERLRLLDGWGARLAGIPDPHMHASASDAPATTSATGDDLIFAALEHTIARFNLPRSLFHDLLSAFRQDVVTTRYSTWADVLDYCRRSANPVGRLVLRVAGHDDPRLDEQSDAVCTALQLTNFWQDLAVDWRRGRLYLPLEDRDRAGALDADLDAGRMSPEWQAALRAVAAKTRQLFDTGRPVCDGVRGRLRWELRFTWLGASRVLDKMQTARFDVFNRRQKLRAADVPALVWQAMRWKLVQAELEPAATQTVLPGSDASDTIPPDSTGDAGGDSGTRH
jgi:phytoene synthase